MTDKEIRLKIELYESKMVPDYRYNFRVKN